MFNNKIMALPASLEGLASLGDVNFGSNKLSVLPSPARWTSATRLACMWNTITVLPDLSPMAETLTQLQFNDNAVTEWPELGPAVKLTLLDASKNKISRLPASIVQLTGVVTLNLRGNALTELPEAIGGLTSMETLDVGVNA